MDINEFREQENCIGYHGFGTGWNMSGQMSELAKLGNIVAGSVNQACDKCQLSEQCWEKHKERVRSLVPELCAYVDEKVAEGITGMELFQHLQEEELDEPYMTVMVGNVQDGAHVKATGKPIQRSIQATLPYPFKK